MTTYHPNSTSYKHLYQRTKSDLQIFVVLNPLAMKASQHAACHERWSYHVPPEILIIRHVSDLLIVFNSSINFVVYCFVEQSFRQGTIHI